MIRLTWASVVALLSILSCATAATPSAPTLVRLPGLERISRKERVRQLLPHAVRVYVYEGDVAKRSASGVVVATETGADGILSYVVTNAHAVDAAGLKDPVWKVVVENQADVKDFKAEVMAVGKVPEMDLALLRIPGAALAPAELADDEELELGDDVIVIGAPYGKGLSLSGGMVSLVEWDRESRTPKMLKTDAPIGYGASGGGIFSLTTGKLLAIVEGYRTAKVGFAVQEQAYSFDVPMPGETFAAPSAKVRTFLKGKGYAGLLTPRGGAASEVVRAAVR